jgi:hypothetical protein
MSAATTTTRKPGSHGSGVTSRRTVSAVKRILVEQALAGNPVACAEVLRLHAERALGDDDGEARNGAA